MMAALGYSWGARHPQKLIKTGVISFSTMPENATLYLNRKKISQKTPAVLMNLLPGEYTLRAELEGHAAWQGRIQVEAEKAASIEKVVLVSTAPDADALTEERVKSFEFLQGHSWVLARLGSDFKDLQLIQLEKGKGSSLALPGTLARLRDAKVLSVYTVPESRFVLVRVSNGGKGDRLLKIEIRENPSVSELPVVLSEEPEWLGWDASQENVLFYQSRGSLYRIDLKKSLRPERLSENVRGVGISKGKIFYVTGTAAYRVDVNGGKTRALLADSLLGQELFDPERTYRIVPSGGGTIFFLNDKGGLFTNRLPYWITKSGVRGVVLDSRKAQAASWTETGIMLAEFASGFMLLEEDFDPAIRSREIFSAGHDIRQVYWMQAGSHWVYRDGDKAFLMQASASAKSEPQLLAAVDEEFGIAYDDSTGRLVYTDPQSGKLMSQRVLPKRDLLSSEILKTGSEIFFEKDKVTP